MSKPVTPGWPEAGAFPFMSFPLPGATSNPASGATPPLIQGLTGGLDLMKDFWSQLPGATPLPGFLVPTVDVEELDKRIADLKAAHSWVEVNLNLLRTTIQGLEVQRHTIAAIRSLATPLERPASMDAQSASTPPGWPAAAAAATATATKDSLDPAPAASGAAANWLGYLQEQFAKVAQAAVATSVPATKPETPRAAAPVKKSKPAARSSRKPT